jgi:hypothetical protein
MPSREEPLPRGFVATDREVVPDPDERQSQETLVGQQAIGHLSGVHP